MSVPAPRKPHQGGRWETIRYALDTNPRTFRLCLILFVAAVAPCLAAVIAEMIGHMLLWALRRDPAGVLAARLTRRQMKISVNLTPSVLARLDAYASAHRWSRSTAAAELIEEGLRAAEAGTAPERPPAAEGSR